MKSLLFVLGLSLGVGSGCWWAWGPAIGWTGFTLTLLVQILVGWSLNKFEQIRLAKYAFEQRLDEERILIANSIVVKCAGCHTENTVPVLMKERNTFKCRKCEAENVIIVQAETALTTNPIE